MSKADAATAGVERSLGRLSKKSLTTDQIMSKVGKVGKTVFLGAAAGIAVAEKKAADFNAQMATVQTLSHANTRQFDQLSRAAKTVGVNIGYSATESASAEEELIKAGVSLKDILSGGLKGALDLAAAGQTDVATATSVAASAMTQFSLKGAKVPHIADLLAAGADKALGSVTDLGYGLAQVGTTAHQMGFSIEATTGTLAQFAQSGLLGESGGAALKQMLLRLANPTAKASELMKKYGLSLYDANGQIKSMPQLAGNLQRSFKNLAPAQRNAALGTIFGSRAIQAANILLKDGEKGNRAWIKSINDQAFAAHQASGKMNSLKGDLQKLDAQLGNAFIDAGGKQGFLRGLTQDLTGLVKKYNQLSTAQKALVGKGVLGAAGLGAGLLVASKLFSLAKGTAALYRGVGGVFGRIAGRRTASTLADTVAKDVGGGVQKVFVTNPGFGGVPGKPGVPVPPGAPAAESGLKGLISKFAPAAALTARGSFAGVGLLGAGVTLGGRNAETSKPGRFLDGSRMVTAGNITPAELARLDKSSSLYREIAATRKADASTNRSLNHLLVQTATSGEKYAKVLRTVPKQVRSVVSTPGSIRSIADMEHLTRKYKLTPKQVRTIMQLQGFSETQQRIVAAGRAYKGLPKGVKTAISTPGAIKSEADVQRLQRRYGLTPAQKTTVMKVAGVDASIAGVRNLQGAINNLHGATITNYVRTRNLDGRGPVGHGIGISADGSTVPKTGRGYADRHLYLLADGEEVISNRHGQADKHRALLKAINNNRLADGGTTGTTDAVSSRRLGSSISVIFPTPAILKAAVSAANEIAVAAAYTARSSKDIRTAQLDSLHTQQQARDLQKSLNEHVRKSVKFKSHHKDKHGKIHTVTNTKSVSTGAFKLRGLDRKVAYAELADARAQLAETRKAVRTEALAAIAEKRKATTETLTATGDIFARGASALGAVHSIDRDIADISAYGQTVASLKAAGASPALLALVVAKAESGDLRSANRLGQALLAQPATLSQLNSKLATLGKVSSGVATLTTDPRFSTTAAFNPTSQVSKVVKVDIALNADPSTWTPDIARVLMHRITTELAGA